LLETGKTTQDLINLIAHKNPNLKVLELNLSPKDTSSLWIQEDFHPIRAAPTQYNFAVSDPTTLVTAQGLHSPHAPFAQFGLLDITRTEEIVVDTKFDLVIVKASEPVEPVVRDRVLKSVSQSVENSSIILGLGYSIALGAFGSVQAADDNLSIVRVETEKLQDVALPTISYISLTGNVDEVSSKILGHIVQSGWNIQKVTDASTLPKGQIVLILDELVSSIMTHPDTEQWNIIKQIIQKQSKILWVTSGAHLNVSNPNAAAINRFFRSVRAEEGVRLVNLDVEHPTGNATGSAIVSCLDVLLQPETAGSSLDSEFVERGGVLQVSRLLPN
jgi:hypothetical protein